jgi:hypothetical protein
MLLGDEIFQNKFTTSPSRFAIHRRRNPFTKPSQNGATISGSILCVRAFCDIYSGTNDKASGPGMHKPGLSYDSFQNTKQCFIIRCLTLSMAVFLDVLRLVIRSAGDGMTILENGLFQFFPNDFSNFAGIYIYLN